LALWLAGRSRATATTNCTGSAAKFGVVPATVSNVATRFVDERLDGLLAEPCPGGPRSISDEQIEAVIVATLERTRRTPRLGPFRAGATADAGHARVAHHD
jgi:transposase